MYWIMVQCTLGGMKLVLTEEFNAILVPVLKTPYKLTTNQHLFSQSILRVENLKYYHVIFFMEFPVNLQKKKCYLSLVLWGLCLKLAQSELWKEPAGKVLNFGDNVKVKRETKRNVFPRFVK